MELLVILSSLSSSAAAVSSEFVGLSEDGMKPMMYKWSRNKSLMTGVLSDEFYVFISSILAYPLTLLKGARC
jgi:L-asparagine transporter-like permease